MDIKTLLKKERYDFSDLVTIMAILRSEEGCPWDREQDHKSIRNNFIEETYEVIEAIDTDDIKLLREELGDVLLQVVFHARMEEELGNFDIHDVANDICAKLISRHPHIFADVTAKTSEAVLQNWEKIKQKEKSRETVTSNLRSVPFMLPALMRAAKVGKNAAKVGFDFPDAEGAMSKVYEELEEVRELLAKGEGESSTGLDEEIGDLLFAVVNLARKAGVDGEAALNRATDKFICRFEKIEKRAAYEGRELAKMSLEEMDSLWDRIKMGEKWEKLNK
ncbi:MAG: nucleoside triphosphate pyrophosphohydrolase [Clostridiales bacterium]|nr:nucleoside triphosphate pyrophosphohydrolase [Clostridiales bacterium]